MIVVITFPLHTIGEEYGLSDLGSGFFQRMFSPVLIIGLAAGAHFIIDLLVKAIHVIRCCDGESQTTGEDLLRRLKDFQNREGAFRAP